MFQMQHEGLGIHDRGIRSLYQMRGYAITALLMFLGLWMVWIDVFDVHYSRETFLSSSYRWIPADQLDEIGSTSAEHDKTEEIIEVDPNAEGVRSIRHSPRHSKIEVHLDATSRCPRPFLVGRLSGPTLVKLDGWKRYENPQIHNP